MAAKKRAKRIEADPRTEEFVSLFQRYGETVLAHIAHTTGHKVEATMLQRVNREVEPMLRSRIEALVKDYLRTAYESLTGEEIDTAEVGYRVQFPSRRRYHLRFLMLSFSDLVALDDKALVMMPDGNKLKKGEGTPAIFAKSIVEGLDSWTRAILDGNEVANANSYAFQALDQLDITADATPDETDRDQWRRLHELPNAMQLICPVLLPLMRPFLRDFEGSRTQMQRLIGAGSNGQVQLNAKSWDLLFARIFGRILRVTGDEAFIGCDKDAASVVNGVLGLYRKWRAENQLK